ncbi:hypothetical protein HID58_047671, partial [Brassica napus]
ESNNVKFGNVNCFKDSTNKAQRQANLKLSYLAAFHGVDMAWAAFHAVEVVSSSRFAHKRIGYHVIAQSFSDQTPVLLLITNQLRKDLNSSNEYEKSQDDDDDFVPMPMVLKDQDADPEATIVQISFGDRLRVLIDTMRALKDLGLDVIKGTVSIEGSVKQTKFSITKLVISLRCFPLLSERGDLSRSVALLDDQATSPSVAVVEEGKQRSLFLSLSSPRRNRDELSLRRIEDGMIKSQTILHNKSQKIKGHMIKYHGSGDLDKNMREWRDRQDHARVEHCIVLYFSITGLCIWSRVLYSCIVLYLVTGLCIWPRVLSLHLDTRCHKQTYKMLCFTF